MNMKKYLSGIISVIETDERRLQDMITTLIGLIIGLSITLLDIDSIYSDIILICALVLLLLPIAKEIYNGDREDLIKLGIVILVTILLSVPVISIFTFYIFPIVDSIFILGLFLIGISIFLAISIVLTSAFILLYLSDYLGISLDSEEEEENDTNYGS